MKFSVIVPVYGVEKYLDECIESLVNQTYKDFEVILVDDKSPDNCPAMCDEWAKKDERIKVIHKEQNQGLGFARNTGIDACSGDFILFVDSDDTIDLETLEKCNSYLDNDTDILAFGIKLCYEDKNGIVKHTDQLMPLPYSCSDAQEKAEIFAQLTDKRVFNYVCNKAYRREFLKSIDAKFESTKLIEDFLFNINVFNFAIKVKSVDENFYFYRKPAHETLASKYSPEFFDLAKRKYTLEEQFLNNCGDVKEQHKNLILQSFIKHFISAIIRNGSKSANLSYSQQKSMLKTMINDNITNEAISQYIPQGLQFKVIHLLMKLKNADLLMMFCKIVDFAQNKIIPLLKR